MQVSANSGAAALQQMQAMHQRMFADADSDGDGSLTVDEFKSIGQNMPAGRSKPAGAPSAEDMFAKLDTNGDGKLSSAEAEPPRPQFAPESMSTLLESQSQDDQNSLLSLLSELTAETEEDGPSSTNDQTSATTTTSKLSDLIAQLVEKFSDIEKLTKSPTSTSTIEVAA